MHCRHCREKTDSMGDTCEHCGQILSDLNPEFISKLRDWLDEQVVAGEISRVKAMLLVHLATKPVREVIIMDGWPKQPKNMEAHANEDTLDFSAGEVQKVPDSEIHFSFLEVPLPYVFSWREYMDDPHIRVIMRADVSLVKQNAVWEKFIEIMQIAETEGANSSRSREFNMDDLTEEQKLMYQRIYPPPLPREATETNEIDELF